MRIVEHQLVKQIGLKGGTLMKKMLTLKVNKMVLLVQSSPTGDGFIA